jgi:hypothetical protein
MMNQDDSNATLYVLPKEIKEALQMIDIVQGLIASGKSAPLSGLLATRVLAETKRCKISLPVAMYVF